jgi:signal transduction histidine kinase/ActR/RegA family two-component response regulator
VRGEVNSYERQKRYVTKRGEVRWVRAKVRMSPDPSGRAEHTVGVVEDITEHLRLLEAEQARDSAEAANRAKSEFLSRMSHELRTPLNAMLGFAQLMRMQDAERLNTRQRQWIEKTEQAGWHLLAMINDVLDLSRIEAGHLRLQIETLDLPEILRATLALIEPLAARRELRVSTEIAPCAVAAPGDATRVKQILTNMLTNAIKYNRDGGKVLVSARLGARGMVELEVVDTGIGMNAEQLASLFQPFNRLGRERGNIEGTGIGLVISQRLAEMMGGSLQVHSTEGVGTAITLTLPEAATPRPVVSATTLDEFDTTGYHQRRVYYIEDNEINAEVMRAILHQRPQVRLQVFGNGLDGLAAVRRQHPDLILLDMHLPDIDGLALLQHLQADPETAAIPVVAVSADALEEQIGNVLSAGAMRYLTKPLSVAEVLATMDDLLARTDTVFG